MKPNALAPTEGNYTFDEADALVTFAQANGIAVRGHALLWHRATPDYFFEGTPAEVKARLQKYITDVVTHFKGKIYAWDVVNEAVTDDGSAATAPYRDSNWYRAAGNSKDYLDWAFEAARAADPDVLLFLNDYNTELPGKRSRLLTVVKDLVDRGIPIDGVGHQHHLQMSSDVNEALKAIDDVDSMFTGLINHVTELDISVYSDPGECFSSSTNCEPSVGNSLPDRVARDQAQKYRDLFNGFAARPSVTSVSLWGLTDDASWLNSYPVDRPNYPLLYDADRNIKTAFQAITDPDFEI
jgi:endo-1,4-beta-xylanase